MSTLLRIRVLAVLVICASVSLSAVDIDSRLPGYQPTTGVSGTIKTVGSDTMNNMMTLWAENFQRIYPHVQVEIEGKGSSTAPKALIEGRATFGPMSRQVKSSESDAFEQRFGYKPVQVATSIDMLAVFVNKSNPIQGLNMQQLDGIFSKTRNSGAPEVTSWGQLGLGGALANQTIDLYGRNAASGTYGYFKKHALAKGDYKDTVKEMPGSSAVVQAVARQVNAIGYSGIGYQTADVRAVPLAAEGTDFVEAIPKHAGEYPLARFLWLTINYRPGTQLDPLRAEFLKFIFSKEGQEQVIKDGYIPISLEIAKESLAAVNISL
jgi:phosphate transport system substrate-binding protein